MKWISVLNNLREYVHREREVSYIVCMKRQKKDIWIEQISSRLELPRDLVMGETFVHLIGRGEIYAENYQGIAVYHDACIRLNIKGGQLEITGKKLLVEHYSEHSMKIIGCIEQIRYL